MSISDIFSQVTNNYRGTKNDLISGLHKSIQDAENSFVNKGSNAANAVLTSGVGGLLNIAALEFAGNTSGAAAAFSDITGNIGGILNNVNLGNGPSTNKNASYSNGIEPGNSLTGILARTDPLLSFSWYAELPVLTPIQPATQQGGTILDNIFTDAATAAASVVITGNTGTTQCPWYYVEEASCPFRTFSVVSRFKEGREQHYPGKYTVNDLTLGMYMDNSNVSLAYLKTWENLVLNKTFKSDAFDRNGNFGLASSYKKSIFVYLLSASKQQIMVIEYAECWPTNVQDLVLDSTTSTRLIANVKFSVGDVYTTVMPIGDSGISGILNGTLSIRGAAADIVNTGLTSRFKFLSNLF